MRSVYEVLNAAGSAAGAIVAIGVGYTTITDQLPFEKKESHAADMRQVNTQLAQSKSDFDDMKQITQSIQRDQWRAFQLALQGRIDAMTEAINSPTTAQPVRAQLMQARADLQQQLAEISVKLAR